MLHGGGLTAVEWDSASEWGEILHINWDSRRDKDGENPAPPGRGEGGSVTKVDLDRWGVRRRDSEGRQETSMACCKLSLQKLQSV